MAQTSGTTRELNAVRFTDANTGTIVGEAKTILRTTDAGVTWAPQSSQAGTWYRAVSFADSTHGTVVGYGGTILRTTDGGTNWMQSTLPPDSAYQGRATLLGVCHADAKMLMVVGETGTILLTEDEGLNWKAVSNGLLRPPPLRGVSFADGNSGMAVGGWGNVFQTSDGGNTWKEQILASKEWLTAVSHISADTAVVVGRNISRTFDGGATWDVQQGGGTEYSTNYYCVTFLDASHGFTAGYFGGVMRTVDGGSLGLSVPPRIR